jgi:hypothetical protein
MRGGSAQARGPADPPAIRDVDGGAFGLGRPHDPTFTTHYPFPL